MLHINEIELYYEPRQAILGKLTNLQGEPEMDEKESAFLCGIIKKHRPNDIVEVGIAGGGTSAIILSCLKSLSMYDSRLYSIDYSKRFYRDDRYESGFLGKEAREILGIPEENHVVLTGDIACSFNTFKSGIDLLIIDTMHTLPGELLDFITLLPDLNDGAVIVLHDVALPYMLENHKTSVATSVLLGSSAGDKFFNTLDFSDKYANIAAIKTDKNTKFLIENVFLSLMIPWNYMPDDKQLNGYRQVIAREYSQSLLAVFDAAVELNKKYLGQTGQTGWLFPFSKVEKNSRVVIFGAGEVGKAFERQLDHAKYCNIVGIIDNDENRWNDHICSPSEIKGMQFDCVVIAIGNEDIADEIKKQLLAIGVMHEQIVWDEYYIGD